MTQGNKVDSSKAVIDEETREDAAIIETSVEAPDLLSCSLADLSTFIDSNPDNFAEALREQITGATSIDNLDSAVELRIILQTLTDFGEALISNTLPETLGQSSAIDESIIAQFAQLLDMCSEQFAAIETACLNDLRAAAVGLTSSSGTLIFSTLGLNQSLATILARETTTTGANPVDQLRAALTSARGLLSSPVATRSSRRSSARRRSR